MATKTKTHTYTVRIEWPVTYYCDTTVEATSPEEAARLAMEDPDYDSQKSYDDSGECCVAGVSEPDRDFHPADFGNGIPADLGEPVAVAPDAAARAVTAIREAAARLAGLDPALAARLLDAAGALEE